MSELEDFVVHLFCYFAANEQEHVPLTANDLFETYFEWKREQNEKAKTSENHEQP